MWFFRKKEKIHEEATLCFSFERTAYLEVTEYFKVGKSIVTNNRFLSLGSEEWVTWLAENNRFSCGEMRIPEYYVKKPNYILVQKEKRKNNYYWYAYWWHTHGEKSCRVYIGKIENLTTEELQSKIRLLELMGREARWIVMKERKRQAKERRRAYDRARREARKAQKKAQEAV